MMSARTPDPSLMDVCLQLPPLWCTLAPKRGQTLNVSAPCLPARRTRGRARALMGRAPGRGRLPQRDARLANWRRCLHCVSVPSVEEQPPTVEPPQQTCHYRPCFERPCYYADTPALPLRWTHFPTGSVGIPNKWTDVEQDGGNCQNKLMNCKGFASLS